METKHATGPWWVVSESEGGYDIGTGDFAIAYVHPTVQPGGLGYGDPGEAKATAHLISAAPELLEALIEVVEHFDRMPFFDKARAAITKALGGQA